MTDEVKKTTKNEEKPVTTSSPSVSDRDQQKLNEDVERALRIEKAMLERRNSVPEDVRGKSIYEDKRDALVRRLVPEAIPKSLKRGYRRNKPSFNEGATMRVIFDVHEMHNQHINEGWVPVIENGMQVNDRGELMYKRAIEFTRDQKLAAAKMSKDRIVAEMKKDVKGIDKDIVPAEENVLSISEG